MKACTTGLAGVLAGALLGGCATDPLGDLDGTPTAIVADASELLLPAGDSRVVTASVVDGRLTPLEVPVIFTPCDADFAVVADTDYDPVPRTSSRATVTAGTNTDPSCVVLSGGGVNDTLYGAVLPVAFNGALSSATPNVGDTLTVSATGALQFDDDSADVDFGGGIYGEVVERTVTTLRIIVPQPDSAQPRTLIVEGIVVTYVPELVVSLPTVDPVTVTNPYEPNDLPDPAATIAIPSEFYDGFVSATCEEGVGDACDNYYTITLSGTTTFTVTLAWNTEADLDLLFCDAGCGALVGSLAGATANNPESAQVTLNAGTYNLWVNAWENNDEPAHLYKLTITTP
jgi:hypothetical protein